MKAVSKKFAKKFTQAVLTFLLVSSSLSLQAKAMQEANLKTDYENILKPFMHTGEKLSFKTEDGLTLSAVHFANPNATKTLVIVNGRAESWLKYAEVFFDFYTQGYSIYSYDHRGQGQSPHLSSVNPEIGHVRHFSSYEKDLHTFVQTVVVPNEKLSQPLYLFAHSMGGAIAAGYLSGYQTPFLKAVLSCPMLAVNTAPYKEFIAKTIVTTSILFGQSEHYAKGQHDYIPGQTTEEGEVTSSDNRWWVMEQVIKENPVVTLGGASNRWVSEAIDSSHRIRNEMGNIKMPILMFYAGEDFFVNEIGEEIGCSKAQNCNMIRFDDAHHEILQEVDPIRERAFAAIQSFFE